MENRQFEYLIPFTFTSYRENEAEFDVSNLLTKSVPKIHCDALHCSILVCRLHLTLTFVHSWKRTRFGQSFC